MMMPLYHLIRHFLSIAIVPNDGAACLMLMSKEES